MTSIDVQGFLLVFIFLQVDMDALRHMTDDDLKALLIPMVKSLISFHKICCCNA